MIAEIAHLSVMRPGGLKLTERALRYCSFQPGARIADVGCGTGATVQFLRNRYLLEAVGVDIETADFEGGVSERFVQADAAALPFESESLDAVIAECSLSVFRQRAQVLGEFGTVLKRGGRLILTDVFVENAQAASSADRMELPFCMAGLMTQVDIERMLEDLGFSIDILEDHSAVLKDFIIRYILEGNGGRSSQDFAVTQATLCALKKVRPHYLLMIATKGDRP
ncbi:MAG TPA: methyltransferase domain-containing protein [Dissulfurispiraceae bacterium]|nr:methyltransferase domain-containing protein [Dissulfurispiraceae bacterium]